MSTEKLNQPRGQFALAIALMVFSMSAASASVPQETCPNIPSVVEGRVTLNGACIYRQSIVIHSSDTHLNCDGAVFDGEDRREMGLIISGSGVAIANVIVENCVFKRFANHGIFITSGIPDYKKKGDIETLYGMSPTRVTVTNVSTEDNGRSGIYVDDYVTKATIQKSRIQGSGKAGVYLEHSSRENVLRNNDIRRNGFSKDGKREGVAIDSSAHNLIEGNTFAENGAGGIFLYKNCGEKYSIGKSVLRWQQSDHNIITGNTFAEEQVGIWIAARQSRNLIKWDCGDVPMDATKRYYEDFANHNKVNKNTFCGVKVGVRIEGDFNKVEDNLFSNDTNKDIDLPRTMREILLGRPLVGNRISENRRGNCKLN